jgi:prepilin peptidase CpaA
MRRPLRTVLSEIELSEYATAAALISLAAVACYQLRLVDATILLFKHITVAYVAVLLPLTAFIAYYDIRYRRIPNPLVVTTLCFGIAINTAFNGWEGAKFSIKGFAVAFIIMFIFYIIGRIGAGDVKLFAAIASLTGLPLVIPMFFIALLTGCVLAFAICGTKRLEKAAMNNDLKVLLAGLLLPGRRITVSSFTTEIRLSIPYGVAITFGSLIALAINNI